MHDEDLCEQLPSEAVATDLRGPVRRWLPSPEESMPPYIILDLATVYTMTIVATFRRSVRDLTTRVVVAEIIMYPYVLLHLAAMASAEATALTVHGVIATSRQDYTSNY